MAPAKVGEGTADRRVPALGYQESVTRSDALVEQGVDVRRARARLVCNGEMSWATVVVGALSPGGLCIASGGSSVGIANGRSRRASEWRA